MSRDKGCLGGLCHFILAFNVGWLARSLRWKRAIIEQIIGGTRGNQFARLRFT